VLFLSKSETATYRIERQTESPAIKYNKIRAFRGVVMGSRIKERTIREIASTRAGRCLAFAMHLLTWPLLSKIPVYVYSRLTNGHERQSYVQFWGQQKKPIMTYYHFAKLHAGCVAERHLLAEL